MKSKFAKALETIEDTLINLCVVFLIIIIFIILFQIVTRRLGIATSGTEELARYCYVLFVFILWPVAARRGQDLRITVLFDLLSSKVRNGIMGIFHVFMAGYSSICIYSIYLNVSNAMNQNLRAPTNRWFQLSWFYIIICGTFVLGVSANLIRAYFLLAGRESVPTQEEQNEADMSLEAGKVVTDGNSNGKGGNA